MQNVRRMRLRSDWESVKLNIMEELVLQKFTMNLRLREMLLDTGSGKLIEGNYHRDDYWGVDLKTGHGLNHLGIILMNVREKVKNLSIDETSNHI